MRKNLGVLLICCLLPACSEGLLEKQVPVCDAVTIMGGQEQKVMIYGVREIANQTEYKAGHPFNWRWVSKNNFTKSTCTK